MALCSGCGKVFRYLDGDQCSKCRKREEADGDQALLQAIAKRSQCTGCGVLFLFLDDAICDVCREKDRACDGRTAGASVSSARESHVTDDSELASRATASTSSGLGEAQFNIKDSYPGVGDVTASMGDVVHAMYIICLRDGTAVVTHKDVPVAFRLGDNDILPAIDKGLVGVRVGTERVISIPAEMGYGDKKHGKIPPNSALFFQCKVVRIVPA